MLTAILLLGALYLSTGWMSSIALLTVASDYLGHWRGMQIAWLCLAVSTSWPIALMVVIALILAGAVRLFVKFCHWRREYHRLRRRVIQVITTAEISQP